MEQPRQFTAQQFTPDQSGTQASGQNDHESRFSFGDAADAMHAAADAATNAATSMAGQFGSTAAPAPSPDSDMPLLSSDEFVIRDYRCSAIKHPRVTGFLTVTNRRIIFHGRSAASRIVREIPIGQVDGFDSFYGMNVRIGRIILGALLVIGGLMAFVPMPPLALGLIVVGVLLIAGSFSRNYYLTIRIGDPGGRFELGSGPETLLGNRSMYALASDPGPDVDAMLSELGALVNDIKSGDRAAIDRWGTR